MKILVMSFISAVLFTSSVALAGSGTFLVSIDKKGVAPWEVEQAIQSLNRVDPSMGTCYVQSSVQEYIDYVNGGVTDTPYYGVAIVNLIWKCSRPVLTYLYEIERSPRYTIYSNPGIGPFPAVSGSN